MAAAAGDHYSFDWRFADEAGLAFSAVNAMLDLEIAFVSVGINIIGNTRAAEPDGFFENSLESLMQLAKVIAS